LSNSDEDSTSSEDNDEPANYETSPRFTIDEHILPVPANIQLAEWVVKHGIPNTATSDLLKILKSCYDPTLPTDARTLMKTDTSKSIIHLKDVIPGKYFHFGIANGIKNNFSFNHENCSILKLVIGIDGLPLTKSSNSTFWPILCYIRPNSKSVFPIGLYWGNAKPSDSNEFLVDFYNEICDLLLNGLELINKSGVVCKVKIILNVFYCDVPAKSFVLKTKGHSGYFSCSRCKIEGEYLNRGVCFPELHFTKRTHEQFVNKEQEEHHIGSSMSILINIPNINIINCFSLDYMHLICLGIVKKLIKLWLRGPLNVRIQSSKSKILSSLLISLKSSITNDFQRKPRSVDEVSRWKATEFRTFLIYLGPLVLKNVISEQCYLNFMCLHTSISLLLTPNLSDQLLNYCNELLVYFVKKFAVLYGKEWISHNVHSVLHICDDYKMFGPLDECSCFPFENHMKTLKKFVRKSHQPLQQAVKRYSEHVTFKPQTVIDNSIQNNIFTYKNQHSNGPIIIMVPYLKIKSQFKNIHFKNTEVKINDSDCYVQTKRGDIVKIVNICHTAENEEIIIGFRFKIVTSYYQKPLISSKLNIFSVSDLNNSLEYWSVDYIKCKCMVLKYNENNAVSFALIHTYITNGL